MEEQPERATPASEQISQAADLTTPPGNLAVSVEEKPSGHVQASSLFTKIWKDIEEPAVVIIGHGFLIVFGLLILSLLGWILDLVPMSDTAKHVAHSMDEYLMIFAFVVLGFSFIIKIVTVVLGGGKK